jgi:nucleotide-binding universal stress UspA family protein
MMGYRTILTYLPNEWQAAAAIEAAAVLARRSNAHLTGLYVVPLMRLYATAPYGGADATAELLAQHEAFHAAQAEAVRALFERKVAGDTFTAAWAKVDSSFVDPLETIMEHGRTAELIVATQDDPEEPDMATGIAQRLMMNVGRPVLMVPARATVTSIGRDITVGWNGSRESARAVFDALPLLREAEMVHLVWVDPRVDPGESPSRAADALAATLARSGVTCEAVQGSSQGRDVGDELLQRVADYGSDLLVMGGYGHSRLHQWVFGGVTRKVLATMPVPVLMSH